MPRPRRFFYDCEFSESPQKIQLISIGIAGLAPGEYYAEFDDFDEAACSDWVKEHVFPKLLPKANRKPTAQIRQEILDFLRPTAEDPVELWGYYSAYDHVALCWLFGPMVALPPGMPMLTYDVEQFRATMEFPRTQLPPQPREQHSALADARWVKAAWLALEAHANTTKSLRG